MDLSLSLAESIARNAPLALRAAKQAISRSEDLALETGNSDSPFTLIVLMILSLGLDFERATYETLLTTRDRTEALEAFREKRRPIFTGE